VKGKTGGPGVKPGPPVDEPVAAKGFTWFPNSCSTSSEKCHLWQKKNFLTTASILVMMSHNEAVNEQNIPCQRAISRFPMSFGLLGGKSRNNKMIGLLLPCLSGLPAAPGWTAGGGETILH
jgi:hypothetical protein